MTIRLGARSATPEPKQYFGIVQFKHQHPRYPKTPLLAYGVQWYGCLDCHPYGTQGTKGGGGIRMDVRWGVHLIPVS